jgi:hypothetical protein
LDPDIAPLLSATVGMRFLLDRGVKSVHLLDMDLQDTHRMALDSTSSHVIYFVRPQSKILAKMCTQVLD